MLKGLSLTKVFLISNFLFVIRASRFTISRRLMSLLDFLHVACDWCKFFGMDLIINGVALFEWTPQIGQIGFERISIKGLIIDCLEKSVQNRG